MLAAGVFQDSLLFMAFLLVVSGFLLKRSARRQTFEQDKKGPPLSSVDAAIKRIEACEARLNDYSRETDAAYQTRAAVLRELIVEADESATLLCGKTASDSTCGNILSVDRRSQAERFLRQAGYSDEQVVKLVDRLIDDEHDLKPDRRAA